MLRVKSYEEATEEEDIVNVVSEIEDEDTAYETKHTEKTCIKCFYPWLRGEDRDEYPIGVKWIKSKTHVESLDSPRGLSYRGGEAHSGVVSEPVGSGSHFYSSMKPAAE
ncbi:MAG TPA: hypothetical protein VJN71_00750 [Nitrososphaerales archaeon]|nr:hypothetical protein [Nitrososphaerales archaeon]